MHTATARRWASLIDQAERSPLTQRAFAEQAGVNPNTLAWWKWRLGGVRGVTAVAPFIEVVETPDPAPAALELWLRDNVQLVVDSDTDLVLLRRVVDALC